MAGLWKICTSGCISERITQWTSRRDSCLYNTSSTAIPRGSAGPPHASMSNSGPRTDKISRVVKRVPQLENLSRRLQKLEPVLRIGHDSPWSDELRCWVEEKMRFLGLSASVGVCLSLLLCTGSSSAAGILDLIAVKFPWEHVKEQVEPSRGSCATCIGVVDDTLGSCSATPNCVSSFDDRPMFFVAPWEFPGKLEDAVEKVRVVLLRSGATLTNQSERYMYAVFLGEDGEKDDVEFLFSVPTVDATVNLRAASRATDVRDSGRNRKRLEQLRMALDWEQVPVLRNRQRRLFFIESPWDSFGPEPPPTIDYKDGVEFVPE